MSLADRRRAERTGRAIAPPPPVPTGPPRIEPGVDKLVTVTMNTVRENDAFAGRHVLRTIADQLRAQTFDLGQLELVIVDGLQVYRPDVFKDHDYPFRIVHVAPRSSPMVRDRRCAICAYKNTAIAHARGQLLVTMDDGGEFDPEYVTRCWDAWQEGLCLSAMWQGDTRHQYLGSAVRCIGPRHGNVGTPPMYGYAAFPLCSALDVNGYDEFFDGSQGLEDIDMGIRLQQAGCHLVLDRRHTVGLGGSSPPWSPRLFADKAEDRIVKCCRTTFVLQRTANRIRANEVAWSDAIWAKVTPRCYLLQGDGRCADHKQPCPYRGGCADVVQPGLQALRHEPPIFDLRTERLKVLTAMGV